MVSEQTKSDGGPRIGGATSTQALRSLEARCEAATAVFIPTATRSIHQQRSFVLRRVRLIQSQTGLGRTR